MLSKGEAAALLSLRNSHHGNAQWDDLQLDAFRSELNPGISADEAREAMRRFYASDHDGRWCGSGEHQRDSAPHAQRGETLGGADRPRMRDATTHAGTGVGIPAAADAGRQPQRGVPQHPAGTFATGHRGHGHGATARPAPATIHGHPVQPWFHASRDHRRPGMSIDKYIASCRRGEHPTLDEAEPEGDGERRCVECGRGETETHIRRDGYCDRCHWRLRYHTDEELAQAMDDCLVHNQERGRL